MYAFCMALLPSNTWALELSEIQGNLASSYSGTFKWRDTSNFQNLILIWLLSVPAVTLISLFVDRQFVFYRGLLITVLCYNFLASVALIWHVTVLTEKISESGARPGTFFSMEAGGSIVIALIAGANAIALTRKLFLLKQVNEGLKP